VLHRKCRENLHAECGLERLACTPSGTYWLYNSSGKVIMKIQSAPRSSPLWNAITSGYTATQRWCTNNSATCSVAASAAVSYIMYLWTNPNH
jgi:hypothetical protein